MYKEQEDKLGMYDNVANHNLQQAKLIEERYPALHNGYMALNTTVAAIRSTAQLYKIASKGQTTVKNEQKAEMAGFSSQVAGAIFAWASDNKNTVLQEKVRYSQTDLLKMRDEELVNTAEMLYGMINENQANLTAYGISKEVADAYKQAMDNYKAAVPAPRNAVAMRKAYRDKLKGLFKEADNILKNKIDKLILPLKNDNPEYWNAYKANRRIVSSATNSTAIRILLKDEKTGEPIADANVQIEAIKFQAQSGKTGEVTAKPIPLGAYTITIIAKGYQPATADEVKTTLGKTNTIEVMLKKTA
jgi:Carboxypeptidase regulatory-like domain